MMICPSCGMDLRDENAAECPHCGRTMSDTMPFPIVMPATRAAAAATSDDGGSPKSASMLSGEYSSVAANSSSSVAVETEAPVRGVDGRAVDGGDVLHGPAHPALLLLSDPARGTIGQTYLLGIEHVTIGRAAICGVILPDDALVSRLHAAVRYVDHRYMISDLGSSNGTLVNDLRIAEPVVLAEGDRITIGGNVLVFTLAAAIDPQTPRGSIHPAADQVGGALGEEEAVAMAARTSPPSPTIPLPPATTSQAIGQRDAAGTLGGFRAEASNGTVVAAGEPTEQPMSVVPNLGILDSLDMPATTTAPDTGELEDLWARLADTSSLLTRLTESVAERSRRRQHSIDALLEYLDGVLMTMQPWRAGAENEGLENPAGTSLQTLLTVAQRAAEDPSHLDAVVPLAQYSQSLFEALRALQQAVRVLDAARGGIAQLRRYEHD